MYLYGRLLVSALAATISLSSCAPATVSAGPAPALATGPVMWPPSLAPVGDGFPASGARCRRIGESAATIDFLDHTAILVGCPTPADALQLGGKQVATVDGITLVSVPLHP